MQQRTEHPHAPESLIRGCGVHRRNNPRLLRESRGSVMIKPVGVAVIGAGYWGTKLVREYMLAQQKGNVKLVKVCDSSLAALVACKEQLPIDEELLTTKV